MTPIMTTTVTSGIRVVHAKVPNTTLLPLPRRPSGNPRPIRRLRRRWSKLRHTHAKDSPGQAITLLPLVLNLKGLIKENGAPSFVLVERGRLVILSARLAR